MATLATRLANLAEAIRDKINLMVPRLLPSGGATGAVLAKGSATNYDVAWIPNPNAAPATASLQVVNGETSVTVVWPDPTVSSLTDYIAFLAEMDDSAENSNDMVGLHSFTCRPSAGAIEITLDFAEPQSGVFVVRYKAV